MAKTTIAIMYDFDKTLSTSDMQNFGFINKLGMTPNEFWGETSKLTEENHMDKILSYMFMMVKKSKEKNIPLTYEFLNECGKDVIFHNGVLTWFERINEYASSLGANVEHYIISSGTTEIIMGTPIAKYFKRIYGCNFLYDENGIAIWPSLSINYTQKTQYIFRIAKGALDVTDDDSVNMHMEEKAIPFENMIYIGDGLTDIPCMKIVKDAGGKSIALYPQGSEEKVKNLVKDKRINFVCAADYQKDSSLEKFVKAMIQSRCIQNGLKDIEESQLQSYLKRNLGVK
jgi:2-hydroxy-3-keto-5-methylthiopentenyl-1-phosphate phosphatase